jgi:hypothetical protein
MTPARRNVQPLDIPPLDIIRDSLRAGIKHLRMRERLIKFHFWRGSVEVKETIVITEVPHDSRG